MLLDGVRTQAPTGHRLVVTCEASVSPGPTADTSQAVQVAKSTQPTHAQRPRPCQSADPGR
jgi:hypothetical protein